MKRLTAVTSILAFATELLCGRVSVTAYFPADKQTVPKLRLCRADRRLPLNTMASLFLVMDSRDPSFTQLYA